MGQKLFEIALAGVLAGAAGLYVLFEEAGPARQPDRQWLRESSVADWANRLVADAVVGPSGDAPAAASETPTVLSHPQAATWMVVGNLAIPEAKGGQSRHTYRVVVQRLCDQVAERACWRIFDLELDGGPIALEDTAPLVATSAPAAPADPEPAPESDVRAADGTQEPASQAASETPSEASAEPPPPVKPAATDEVLMAAAQAAARAETVKPAPDKPSAPPEESPSEALGQTAGETSSAESADSTAEPPALPTTTVEDGDAAAPQQAALPPSATDASDDARTGEPGKTESNSGAPDSRDIGTEGEPPIAPDNGDTSDAGTSGSAANRAPDGDEEEPLYTWADPKVLIPIQHQLKARGFKIGVIDGILGPRTRDAIESYQSRHGLPVNGKANAALLRHMTGQKAAGEAAAPQEAPSAAAPPPPVLNQASASPAEGDALVRQIQQRLERLGYVVDKPAGTMGSYTREAISTYQWRYGLPVDGKPSADLLTHLQRQAGG